MFKALKRSNSVKRQYTKPAACLIRSPCYLCLAFYCSNCLLGIQKPRVIEEAFAVEVPNKYLDDRRSIKSVDG